MDIGAFGIDPVSKFATEKCITPKWKHALGGAAVAEDSLPGVSSYPGRVARGSAFRNVACGSAFRLFFIPCKAADPRT